MIINNVSFLPGVGIQKVAREVHAFCLVYNVDIQFEFCGTKVFVTRDQDEDSIIDSYFHARSKIINFREV